MISGGAAAAPHDLPISGSGAARLKPQIHKGAVDTAAGATSGCQRGVRDETMQGFPSMPTYIKVQRRYVLALGTVLFAAPGLPLQLHAAWFAIPTTGAGSFGFPPFAEADTAPCSSCTRPLHLRQPPFQCRGGGG
jgi:hypothetical protein